MYFKAIKEQSVSEVGQLQIYVGWTRARAGQVDKSPWRILHGIWHADQRRDDPGDDKQHQRHQHWLYVDKNTKQKSKKKKKTQTKKQKKQQNNKKQKNKKPNKKTGDHT